MQQQDSDGLSSHVRHQFPFDRFLGHQPNGPAGAALGRIGADHGDDALLLTAVEHLGGSRTLFFIKRTIQSSLTVAVTEPANCLRSEWNRFRDLRSADALGKLQQRQRPQNHADLLDAAFDEAPQLALVLLGDTEVHRWARHTLSMRQNNSA